MSDNICYFCELFVLEEYLCQGCGYYICEDCDLPIETRPFKVEHTVEMHRRENHQDRYEKEIDKKLDGKWNCLDEHIVTVRIFSPYKEEAKKLKDRIKRIAKKRNLDATVKSYGTNDGTYRVVFSMKKGYPKMYGGDRDWFTLLKTPKHKEKKEEE